MRQHRASRGRPEEAPLLQARPPEGAFRSWSPALRITTKGTRDLRAYNAAGAAHPPPRVRVGRGSGTTARGRPTPAPSPSARD